MGYKWDTSGKAHKPMVEHDLTLIQQEDTKTVKNRNKYEKEHKSNQDETRTGHHH